MSMEDRRIYLIEGGKAAEIRDAWQAKRKAQATAQRDLVRSLGATQGLSYGDSLAGIVCDADIHGMRRDKRHPQCLVPRRSTKAGKAMLELFEKANAAGGKAINAEDFFEGETWYVTGTAMFKPSFGTVGDQWVVTVHKDCGGAKPVDGLREIKLSEFYAIQEQSESQSAA